MPLDTGATAYLRTPDIESHLWCFSLPPCCHAELYAAIILFHCAYFKRSVDVATPMLKRYARRHAMRPHSYY